MRTPESSVLDRIAPPDLEEQLVRVLRQKQEEALQSGAYDGQISSLSPELLYEDTEFSASSSTLYVDPAKPPEYAPASSTEDESSAVFWYRPQEITDSPAYFTRAAGSVGIVREGSLRDAWLLGALAAIALHPDNLIENLFASESLSDFLRYGVFSCRFFKDDDWVTVTTDTRLPYSVELASEDRFPSSGSSASSPGGLLYGCSTDKNELFLPLLEKAYAKLHGSYEALDAGVSNASSRVLEAFLDLTGGSAHRVNLQHERFKMRDDDENAGVTSNAAALHLWKQLLRYKRRRSILTAQIKQLTFNSLDQTPLGLLKNRLYIIQYVTEVTMPPAPGASSVISTTPQVLRFVKLQTVWGRGMWKGEWSNDDSKWEEHTQVEHALRNDPASGFSRAGRDGCFWMLWEDFLDAFSELFVAHVFSDEAGWHQYSVRGEWIGLSAAGAPSSTSSSSNRPTTAVNRPMTSAPGGEGDQATSQPLQQQKTARETAICGTKWAVLRDADASWFRNPQYRLSVRERTPNVLLSLVQRDFRLYGGDNFAINFVLMKEKAPASAAAGAVRAWEFKASRVIGEARSIDPSDISTSSLIPPNSAGGGGSAGSGGGALIGRSSLPDRELVLKEEVTLEPGMSYLVVPFTDHSRVEMEFFLRVFAPKLVRVEQIPPLFSSVRAGRWRNDQEESGEPTNAGGPLCPSALLATQNQRDVNAAWCQNPQFWVRLPPLSGESGSDSARHKLQALYASKAYATMKLTLVKTSHRASGGAGGAKKRDAGKDRGLLIGITAVRASAPVSSTSPSITGNEPTSSASSSLLALRAVAKAPKTNFLGEELAPKASAKAVSPKRATDAKRLGSKAAGEIKGGGSDDEGDVDAYSADLAREHAVAEAKFALGPVDSQQEQADQGLEPQHQTSVFPSSKLVVAPTEWSRISEYTSPAVACMHLKKLPKEWLLDTNASTSGPNGGGLLVVPSLGEAGIEGTFELTVDCDLPVRVAALPTFSMQSVPGEWRDGESGGCHLHADWRKNPKFYLELKGVRPGRVVITLSRSELEWSGKCKRDVVGTMMGFYLFAGSSKISRDAGGVIVNGRPWTETDFVPLHSVRSPPELVLPAATKEPYVIMPATYEPGKIGKFVLSVQCDTGFALTSDGE